MSSLSLLQTSTWLLAAAAGGGLLMAGLRLSGRPLPPTWLAMAHGLAAASGLALLSFAAFSVGVPRLAEWALGVLLLAALGGAAMNLGFHLKGRPLPVPLMLAHGFAAATGLTLLAVAAYGAG